MGNLGIPLFEEPISAVTATPSVKIGTRRVDNEGNEYVYFHNHGTYLGWPGTPMTISSSNSGYSASPSNAASQTGILAAVVHHATIPTAYYGWGMVRGLCRCRPDSSFVSLDAGAWLGLGVDGGFVSAGATHSTSGRWGVLISSMVTCSGASLASLGEGWIKTIWG